MDNVTRLLMQGAAGAAGGATYVDDVFSTYLYTGNGATQTITNGIDLSDEGGLVWIKERSRNSTYHDIYDTVRGEGVYLRGASTDSQYDHNAGGQGNKGLTGFTNSGFSLGPSYAGTENSSGQSVASWSFRNQKGFFDVVTYTGSGGQSSSPQSINHSLKSIPGMIIIKNLDQSSQWFVYHVGIGEDKFLQLNKTDAAIGYNGGFKNITSSSVGVFDSNSVNGNEYVAYFFAGGESTAATAKSVDFDGSGDYLTVADSDDFSFGSGAFTVEAWIKPTTVSNKTWIAKWVNGQYEWFFGTNGDELKFAYSTSGSGYTILDSGYNVKVGQWQHIAVTRDSSGKIRIFVNGDLLSTNNANVTFHNGPQHLDIAHNSDGSSWQPQAKISNVRIVKGTAVYTTAFRPPTEPLTNITNTKLLCCNDSSTTGSTVTPTTITANGDPTASTDTPFDDPGGYKFGEGGDQNIIKCGSYVGASGANKVNLGWEPQWVMVKNIDSAESWVMMDSMRGWVNQSSGAISLRANSTGNESAYGPWGPTSTGWELDLNQREIDQNGQNYIYIAIRRPDGYVGKPAEVGTGVFTMDTGAGSTTIPNFDSGFPVDFSFLTTPDASGQHRQTGARLTGPQYMRLNGHNAESGHAGFTFDSNVGWGNQGDGSNWQSWMFKRHVGFDVVNYVGNLTTGHQIPHSLNKVPEMIWLRCRTITGRDWVVYHKGLNGGVNPWLYRLRIDHTDGERSASSFFGAAPTTTNFTVGASADSNGNGDSIIAFLFSSVDGISKVGYYDGSATSQTITTGFQPRMVIIKAVNVDGNGWILLDTMRGWGAGNDKKLELDTTGAQSNSPLGAPTATGFTLDGNSGDTSTAGRKYIYYAHA